MQRIRKGLYLLESARVVNCYLIEGPYGLTLFDAGQPLSAPGLIEELENNGFGFKDVDQIVLSHAHFDHSGGARGLLERRRIKVYAHPDDIPAIQGKGRVPRGWIMRLRELLLRLKCPYKPVDNVIPIEQGETLRCLPQWQVLRAPGHTAGSIALYHPTDKVLLCGDALNNREGRLRAPAERNCEDAVLARETVRRLGILDLEVLGCGHGPVIRTSAGLRVQEIVSALT
ncbi:MAG TPA: hypothetical protein DEB40_04425 [Elusimicrobia bacterium]|nr:hypothetical protein [Elusimicrobiota bacterium]HBT60969.1 hypothetical protein [Elusimicrobiota bacterium]